MTQLNAILQRWGMKEVYRRMMWEIWKSPKVSKDNKDWLDLYSNKVEFKFSEEKQIQDLYIDTFGKLPEV